MAALALQVMTDAQLAFIIINSGYKVHGIHRSMWLDAVCAGESNSRPRRMDRGKLSLRRCAQICLNCFIR